MYRLTLTPLRKLLPSAILPRFISSVAIILIPIFLSMFIFVRISGLFLKSPLDIDHALQNVDYSTIINNNLTGSSNFLIASGLLWVSCILSFLWSIYIIFTYSFPRNPRNRSILCLFIVTISPVVGVFFSYNGPAAYGLAYCQGVSHQQVVAAIPHRILFKWFDYYASAINFSPPDVDIGTPTGRDVIEAGKDAADIDREQMVGPLFCGIESHYQAKDNSNYISIYQSAINAWDYLNLNTFLGFSAEFILLISMSVLVFRVLDIYIKKRTEALCVSVALIALVLCLGSYSLRLYFQWPISLIDPKQASDLIQIMNLCINWFCWTNAISLGISILAALLWLRLDIDGIRTSDVSPEVSRFSVKKTIILFGCAASPTISSHLLALFNP